MIWVVGASYDGDYRISIEFSDDTRGIVDLQETILEDTRSIFVALRENEFFRRFHVEVDTLVWDNGLDLAPEYLYDLAVMPSGQRRAA